MSVPAASVVFSAHAQEYSALRQRLVPRFDDFYGAAIQALDLRGEVCRVLDIGAGTGLLSALVADARPQARFDLLDGSREMLAEARATLGDRLDAVYVQDMAAGLPVGPYDVVVSALAIHHLEDRDKQTLFRHVHDVLAPDGLFVNAEQVAASTPEMTAAFVNHWAHTARAQGASEEEIQAAAVRRRHDRCSDIESQLGWLREAGFRVADSIYQFWETAVIVAVKGGA